MRTRFFPLGIVLVLAAITIGCDQLRSTAKAPKSDVTRTGLRPGFLAPEIIGQDLAGAEMKLSDFKGKVVALEFWSST